MIRTEATEGERFPRAPVSRICRKIGVARFAAPPKKDFDRLPDRAQQLKKDNSTQIMQ
jgi:hypothetical protein